MPDDKGLLPDQQERNKAPVWASDIRYWALGITIILIAAAWVMTSFGKAAEGVQVASNGVQTICKSVGYCKPKAEVPSDFPRLYRSGWVEGGHGYSTPTYCDPQKAALEQRYPELKVEMTYLPEGHRVTGGLFKHDEYEYGCAFSATSRV